MGMVVWTWSKILPGVSSQSGLSTLFSTGFHTQPWTRQQWPFGCSIQKARLQGASTSLVILSALFTREPQTGMVLGPKRSPHPKAVLSCLEEEMECRQAEFLASLSCPDIAQIQ